MGRGKFKAFLTEGPNLKNKILQKNKKSQIVNDIKQKGDSREIVNQK